jgi:NTP pyrophosphatase (non-canonical NTP hydrolase)
MTCLKRNFGNALASFGKIKIKSKIKIKRLVINYYAGEHSTMAQTDSSIQDPTTHVQELRQVVRDFVEERDWKQFHSPKNLSMALAVEVAELMEHFQWITPEDSRQLDEQAKTDVGEELADVLCYTLAIANELELDLTSTLLRKMEKNRAKYPVKDYRGRFGKNDPNPVTNS